MEKLFRVIGVQVDGSHIVLATHLTDYQAHAVVQALSKGTQGPVFHRLLIEPQPDSKKEIPIIEP